MNGTTKRIIAIDFMRAFAVLMMIQGHTIHSLLDISYSTSDSFIYNTWIFFRAFTAPFFIFCSGLIFSFLLFKKKIELKNNPRIIKGIKRGVSLITIGYLLRYPTIKIFNLAESSYSQWLVFFSVDALHLIGIGLLLIISFSYLSVKLNVSPIIIFSIFAILIFIFSPYINSIEWSKSSNIFFTSYLTFQFGSIFPLFPYLQYIFLGAVLGFLLSKKQAILNDGKNLLILFVCGAVIVMIAYFIKTEFTNSLLGAGMVVIIFSLFGFLGNKINSIPNFIVSLSRNSLWIYIIHLVILYGSPTSIGLFQIIGKTLSSELTVLIAVLMIILMTIISLVIDKFRVRNSKVIF